MYSVVIPTMWKSNRTLDLLIRYSNCDLVKEIIIIDNNPSLSIDLSQIKKLKKIYSGKNIYVNPAWNFGVRMSSCEKIIISNDDISFDVDKLLYFMLDKSGVFGMHHSGINSHEEVELDLIDGDCIGSGWGCLIFLEKSQYKEIPDSIKVLYGDNWISANSRNPKSIVANLFTEHSTTCNFVFNENRDVPIFDLDKSAWMSILETNFK